MVRAVIVVLATACGHVRFADERDADVASSPDAAPPGIACTAYATAEVPLNGMVSGSLPATSTTQGACGGAGLGEAVFELDADYSGGALLLAADYSGDSAGTYLYVRTNCADPSSELACDVDDGEGNFPELRLVNVPAGRYYGFVDGDGAGDYEALLEVLRPLGAPCDPADTRDRCDADLACTANTCVAASCPIANALSGMSSYSFNADTTTGVNEHAAAPSCSEAGDSGIRAPELVYTVALASAASDLEVSTDSTATTYDTLVYVRATCDGPELACDDDSGTNTHTSVAHTGAIAAGTYFVFIDGFQQSGTAAVTITITP